MIKRLINNFRLINVLCLLFGHKQYICRQTNLISCDRCHLVENHYEDDLFSVSGVVFWPWNWIKNKFTYLKYKLKNRKVEDYDEDDIPF